MDESLVEIVPGNAREHRPENPEFVCVVGAQRYERVREGQLIEVVEDVRSPGGIQVPPKSREQNLGRRANIDVCDFPGTLTEKSPKVITPVTFSTITLDRFLDRV